MKSCILIFCNTGSSVSVRQGLHGESHVDSRIQVCLFLLGPYFQANMCLILLDVVKKFIRDSHLPTLHLCCHWYSVHWLILTYINVSQDPDRILFWDSLPQPVFLVQCVLWPEQQLLTILNSFHEPVQVKHLHILLHFLIPYFCPDK